VGKPKDSRELVDVLAAVHPWIHLVVREQYVPSLTKARTAAQEIVDELELARSGARGDVAHRVLYVERAVKWIPDVSRSLRPDDITGSLDRLLEPAMAVACCLGLDPKSVFFQVIEIIPAMDRAVTTVLQVTAEFAAAARHVLGLRGSEDGRVESAVDRAWDLERALGDVLRALNDFTRSDLRDVDLSTVALDGVLWSRRTRWPSGARREIERASVNLGGGVFVVRDADLGRAGATIRLDERAAWRVSRREAEHMARLWATAGESPAYPLIGSVVTEFDLGYVLTEQLSEEYLPLSAPRWAVVDRVTGDLEMWHSGLGRPLSADIVVERFRTSHAQRPPTTRTWDRAAHDPTATPSRVTYLRLPSLHPDVPDRWVRAYGVEGDTAPLHHPLVRQFLESLPRGVRSDSCSEAAAMSDALHVEDAVRTAAGRPPLTLEQARNRLFANAASLTYRFDGARGPVVDERVSTCRSCELLVRHFSYENRSPDTVENLFRDLQVLAERDRHRAGGPADPADLDAVIALLRRLRQDGLSQEMRDAGTEKLFGALLRRFQCEGSLVDLDDVIELHQVDMQRIKQQGGRRLPALQTPGGKWVEQAYRMRGEITGSSTDSAIAHMMRWYAPDEETGEFDSDKMIAPQGYTVWAAKERSRSEPNWDLLAKARADVDRLRAEPGLPRRVDLLDQLVDALGGLAIGTGSAEATNELIDATEMLVAAIPEDDVHHCTVHRASLGVELYHRRRDAGGGPDDARRAFTHLEHASGVETLETQLRVQSARGAAEAAGSLDDRPAAARMYRRAVDLLPRLVPQSLSSSDHARLLAPMSGLVAEAATGLLHAGDRNGALELLEQGRGLLIGRALDARDGTTEELRRIADELATSPDPHADHVPGEPSLFDRRRELGRAWDREVARIRRMEGFENYLLPLRVGDFTPLAAGGPVVTIVVSGRDANALLLTAEGVDVVHLPELTGEGLDDMVETFWGTLPFAELMPDDEDATVQAQEPLRAVLARLWDTVAAPVLERMCPTEQIWWVPTGMLAALPLHAAGRGADTVLDRVISSYTPTMKVLRASRSRPPGHGDAACVVSVADARGLPPLPNTRAEAFEVMRSFPGVVRLDGPAATPEAVREAVTRSGWLHLACHATSNIMDPANCALHVHGGEVTARDVMSQRTSNGRLAYLSCCRTAMTNGADIADEMIHLGSAFQIAGFRHVVGTLWRVKDTMAATTAALFYEQVGCSEDYAPLALHRTVLQLRERHPLMPARWAPYIHLGG
jgi:hypothetical protein